MSIKLGSIAHVTKLAGFEHTKYIQGNISHERNENYDTPLFIGKTVRNGKIDKNYDWYLPHSISDDLPRSQLTKKCLVMPYVGSLGDLAIFDADERCHLGSNIAKIELNDNCNYTEEFLYYYIKSPLGQKLLFKDVQGAVQKNITMESIRNIELPEIPLNNQNSITYILQLIDNTISCNHSIIEELNQITTLLYNFWFLQFDFPDENGKPYRRSGGKMVWNEELKREIPERWEVKHASDLTTVKTGKEDANFAIPNGKYAYFTCGQDVLKCDIPAFEGRAVLLAGNGDFNVKHYTGRFNAYQRTYVLIPNDKKYYAMLYIATKETIEKFKKGSAGSIVKFITLGDVKNITVLDPHNDDMLEKFNTIIDKIELIQEENQQLAELRDFLLPMLMNGQVKIKEPEYVETCGGIKVTDDKIKSIKPININMIGKETEI